MIELPESLGEVDRLAEPLKKVVGDRSAKALAKLGLETVGDLLAHYPRRYAEPGRMSDLADLEIGEHVTVMARVRQATIRDMRARSGAMLQAVVTDGVGELSLTFFAKHRRALHQHEQRLCPGATGLFTGQVSQYQGKRQLAHPDYLLLGADVADEDALLVEGNRPIPIYPATAGLPSWRIQQAVRTVLDPLTDGEVPDPVPAEIRTRRGLDDRLAALRLVHEPYSDADWRTGQQRLRYDEAFVLQTALARRRAARASEAATARLGRRGGLLDAFDARLPFVLTAGQREVASTLAAEVAGTSPMQRLLQGEVGSGKTVVALRAMLQVVDSGGQAALLAPTEVLAAQHVQSLRDLLGELAEGGMLTGSADATRLTLLTGSQSAAQRRAALAEAAGGAAGIVVGTHALLGEHVQFADLGLVVVDEQHRFGVEQRDVLRAKGAGVPHLLVMTATPIPRTVAMTVFGDLEVSTLREIPAGRSPVVTHVVPADRPTWMDRVWQRVREQVDSGYRVYVVCPRIDAGDAGDQDGADLDPLDVLDPEPGQGAGAGAGSGLIRPPLRAVDEVVEELRARPVLAGVSIGVLHGRLPTEDKARAMGRFAAGDDPVLVATTVVEVGVDVPLATIMVVLDADRFGLSQLHQLRGRVGRGAAPGTCFLVSHASEGAARTRLELMERTTDGFELASADLELRREGDVLGSAQSGGRSSLRLLRVARDGAVIEEAREDARDLVEVDPDLAAHPALAAAIEREVAGEHEEYLERT